MPWPTVPVVTTGMDADTDNLPRADILDHTNKFNQLIAMRGVAGGVCDLDASALIPSTRLPAVYQPLDASLTSLSGLSLAPGDVVYATGADAFTRLPKGTASQVLAMNAGATAPEWAAPAVSSVTGTAPVVSSGGSTPAISMPAASAGANGYMSAAYASKLDGIQAGANYFVGVALDNGFNAVGSFALALTSAVVAAGGAYTGLTSAALNTLGEYAAGPALSGTWRCVSGGDGTSGNMVNLYQRIA